MPGEQPRRLFRPTRFMTAYWIVLGSVAVMVPGFALVPSLRDDFGRHGTELTWIMCVMTGYLGWFSTYMVMSRRLLRITVTDTHISQLMPGYRKRLNWNEGAVLPDGVTTEASRTIMK